MRVTRVSLSRYIVFPPNTDSIRVGEHRDMRGREHRPLIEAQYSYGGDSEDRLTEALASLTEANPRFFLLPADRLGPRGQPERFVVQTQVGRAGLRRPRRPGTDRLGRGGGDPGQDLR
jgi:hypothetical protein